MYIRVAGLFAINHLLRGVCKDSKGQERQSLALKNRNICSEAIPIMALSGFHHLVFSSTLLYPSLCWTDDQHKGPMIETKII